VAGWNLPWHDERKLWVLVLVGWPSCLVGVHVSGQSMPQSDFSDFRPADLDRGRAGFWCLCWPDRLVFSAPSVAWLPFLTYVARGPPGVRPRHVSPPRRLMSVVMIKVGGGLYGFGCGVPDFAWGPGGWVASSRGFFGGGGAPAILRCDDGDVTYRLWGHSRWRLHTPTRHQARAPLPPPPPPPLLIRALRQKTNPQKKTTTKKKQHNHNPTRTHHREQQKKKNQTSA